MRKTETIEILGRDCVLPHMNSANLCTKQFEYQKNPGSEWKNLESLCHTRIANNISSTQHPTPNVLGFFVEIWAVRSKSTVVSPRDRYSSRFSNRVWAQRLWVRFPAGDKDYGFIGQVVQVSRCMYTWIYFSSCLVTCLWARGSVEMWAEHSVSPEVGACDRWSSSFSTLSFQLFHFQTTSSTTRMMVMTKRGTTIVKKETMIVTTTSTATAAATTTNNDGEEEKKGQRALHMPLQRQRECGLQPRRQLQQYQRRTITNNNKQRQWHRQQKSKKIRRLLVTVVDFAHTLLRKICRNVAVDRFER